MRAGVWAGHWHWRRRAAARCVPALPPPRRPRCRPLPPRAAAPARPPGAEVLGLVRQHLEAHGPVPQAVPRQDVHGAHLRGDGGGWGAGWAACGRGGGSASSGRVRQACAGGGGGPAAGLAVNSRGSGGWHGCTRRARCSSGPRQHVAPTPGQPHLLPPSLPERGNSSPARCRTTPGCGLPAGGRQSSRAHNGVAGGLVVVEEVAAQQDEVGVVGGRHLKHLLKRGERVVLADLVLLPHALSRARRPASVSGAGARAGGRKERRQQAAGGGGGAQARRRRTRWLSVLIRMRSTSSSLRGGGQETGE